MGSRSGTARSIPAFADIHLRQKVIMRSALVAAQGLGMVMGGMLGRNTYGRRGMRGGHAEHV